jgi:hypothetical protein
MAKPTAAKFPMLKAAWDEYGHMIKWEDLFDVKMDRGCYAVLAWKEEDGMVQCADMVRGGINEPWEMQNDGGDSMTEAEWKELRIVPDCDWFEIPSRAKNKKVPYSGF